MQDKRQYPRVELNVLVNYSTNAVAWAKNISETGICLTADKQFKVDNYLTLVFSLPPDNEIKVYAKVIWNRQIDNNKYENGLQFWHISEFARKKLQSYVNEILFKKNQ